MNKTIATGNVGAEDAQLGKLPSGVPVLNFSFATNETRKDKEGQKKTYTTWYKVAFFGDRATNLAPFVVSGKRLLVVGRVKANAWLGEDDKPKADLVLMADEIELEGGVSRHDEGSAAGSGVGVIDEAEEHEGLFQTE